MFAQYVLAFAYLIYVEFITAFSLPEDIIAGMFGGAFLIVGGIVLICFLKPICSETA